MTTSADTKYTQTENIEQQSDLFSFLGCSLNDIMYRASTDKSIKARDLTLEDLKTANKVEFYNACDIRLKAFIDSLTAKTVYNNEDTNFKSNVYENLLKSRNHKFVSTVGLKEHMVAHLSSGKSMHTTQVFSKQGGKGTRPLLEINLKNSESVCTFKAPDECTLLASSGS